MHKPDDHNAELPQAQDALDIYWMQYAFALAERAEQLGEVPVGAVLVRDGKVIGEGWNQSISQHDPSAHAEILALRSAGLHDKNYRLPNSTLYVSLEPCMMCAGSLLHARIERLVFAAFDPKTGAVGGAFNVLTAHAHYHTIKVQGGVLEEQGRSLIQTFFRQRRLIHKQAKK